MNKKNDDSKPEEIKVFISHRDSTCGECKEELGRKAWITLQGDDALCLECSELDHLEFLQAGDAALTRRSKKHSQRYAVVLQWSKRRKRYERQGLLVEAAALAQAEEECLSDQDVREKRRQRDAERREILDQAFISKFAERVRELYPGLPGEREQLIAEHACMKYSGRVGRSAAAKQLNDKAVRLAVVAHIRHTETDYDSLLGRGVDRHSARAQIASKLDQVASSWERAG